MKNPYAVALGRLGGAIKSEAKARASKINGKKGGRPKLYAEATALESMKDVLEGKDWQIVFMNFVDGFRRKPSYALISAAPDSTDSKMYALLQSICIQLCLEQRMRLRGWLLNRAFLPSPWFVSGFKSLMATALKESPPSFKKNNIFVLGNFLKRV